MTDQPRLIEHAFPLEQASLNSVHEKNVRHGHISTLHIWPARRPLAACRAALIATLLPDPGTPEERKKLCEMIGGKVVKKIERKQMPNGHVVERVKKETEGGSLHWLGAEPTSGGKKKLEAWRQRARQYEEGLEWFRQQIRKAYGGRAPRVLDPFAGGGAIPLEAMRLGCEVTAIDINPVAWFILKCTLEYPQKLAGQMRRLPDFAVADREFMSEYLKKAKGFSAARIAKTLDSLGHGNNAQGGLDLKYDGEDDVLQADLAWHVRAWGRWVLARARKDLARYYPTYADFEPLKPGEVHYEPQPMRLVPLRDNGTTDIDALNAEFADLWCYEKGNILPGRPQEGGYRYLDVRGNPRWIAKPTVAYLRARTVKCKNCRAMIPLLKTRWLCRKANKRVLLTMEPNADRTGVVFGVEKNVSQKVGNAARRREHDKRIGAGTMSRAGAKCPCCDAIMTMEDIRVEGKANDLGNIMTVVVIDTPKGKDYRLPTDHELTVATPDEQQIVAAFESVPFGVPDEPTPAGGGAGAGRAFSVQGYGLMRWRDLFTPRQLTALGAFVTAIRAARNEMTTVQPPTDWTEAIGAYLACGFDRMLDFNAATLSWITSVEAIGHTFVRFALPVTWDYSEAAPINGVRGGWEMCLGAVMESQPTLGGAAKAAPVPPKILKQSAVQAFDAGTYDAIVTDPPYYDAIPYSDLMDYFYIWERRTLHGLSHAIDEAHASRLSSKWDHDKNDGELIDDASRHGNDAAKSKRAYENGMARVFVQCATALNPEGRLVIVFANKRPDAWETLVSAIIRAGFVVDGSWPIQTEQAARMRAQSSAALASSVWLVGRKRPATARPGWDNIVLAEMRENIANKLREFWDAGIRGPDFVWAATGPALEAYSKYPVVKKADEPGPMTVSEFLRHVRRMVVDYVVGRVLSGDGEGAEQAQADRLDEPTAYYLLHRHDFGMEEAPAGTCILYAVSCGMSDRELADTWDILARTGGSSTPAANEDEEETDPDDMAEEEAGSGSTLKLKTWAQRKGKSMGYEAPGGKPVPMIDRIHRLMHLWRAGDVHKVDEYIDDNGLRRHELFKRLLQSLIELSPAGSDERSLLESLSNHIGSKGVRREEASLFEKETD